MYRLFYRFFVLTFVFIFTPFLLQGYQVCAKDNTKINIIKTDKYTLEYGNYKGFEIDYDYAKQKAYQKEVHAILSKNKITINGISEKFKVKGNKLYINKTEMYEVIGNNKLLMLAGGGIIFEHE